MLRLATVKAPTPAAYSQAVTRWCRLRKHALHTLASADHALTLYMHHLNMTGGGVAKARYARYGYLLLETDLDGDRQNRLPLSRKALSGFQTLDPSRTRNPIPVDVLAMLSQYFADRDQVAIAVLLMFQFDTYSRPSEALRVQPEDFVTAPKNAAVSSPLRSR